MNTPISAKKPFKALDPLKYALHSLVSLWHIAFGLAAELALAEFAFFSILTVTDMLFNASRLNISIGAYIETINQYHGIQRLLINTPLTVLIPVLATGIILITIIQVGLMETALTWYDTGTASLKNLIPQSYKVVAILIAWHTFTTTSNYSTYLLNEQGGAIARLLLSLIIVYISIRYFFCLYYMIDTQATLGQALKHTQSTLWRLRFLDILLYLILFAMFLNIILPYWGATVIDVWVFTFATVYMYRALFPREAQIDRSNNDHIQQYN